MPTHCRELVYPPLPPYFEFCAHSICTRHQDRICKSCCLNVKQSTKSTQTSITSKSLSLFSQWLNSFYQTVSCLYVNSRVFVWEMGGYRIVPRILHDHYRIVTRISHDHYRIVPRILHDYYQMNKLTLNFLIAIYSKTRLQWRRL